MKSKAKPATRLKEKKAKETQKKRPVKPIAKAVKPTAKAAKSVTKAKPTAKAAKSIAKTTKPVAKAVKPTTKVAKPAVKPAKSKTKAAKPVAKVAESDISSSKKGKKSKKTSEVVTSNPTVQLESALMMVPGAKFVKIPFFFDIEEEASKRKYIVQQKLPEKPTACSRPKISSSDNRNMVEFLSQQLEYENKTYFEGCEGQICVKCNVNTIDAKFYVDKSLGYCTECATLLGLGQSKEGVFSDAQMELMRHSMEKSMENLKDIEDENDIESALVDDIDSLESEETLLSEEDADFNV
jgi:Uncharacterized membrane-bound protein